MEFKSKWQEDMKALGRRPDLSQNLPWTAEFDRNFQNREDVSGLVEAERLVPGSGLDVSSFVGASTSVSLRRHLIQDPDSL